MPSFAFPSFARSRPNSTPARPRVLASSRPRVLARQSQPIPAAAAIRFDSIVTRSRASVEPRADLATFAIARGLAMTDIGLPTTSARALTRVERVGAHSHVRGLGLDDALDAKK